MENKKILRQFEEVEKRINKYQKLVGGGLYLKVKRFLFLGRKYSLDVLAKKGILKNREVSITFFWDKNKTIKLPLGDFNSHSLYYFGSLGYGEIELTKFLIRNLREYDVFYDVGANYGFYTALASKLINKREIHSFEPNPVCFSYLSQLKGSNVFLNSTAVCNMNSEIKLFVPVMQKHSGISTIVNSLSDDMESIAVKGIRLDDYVKQCTPPTYIKIDIEGAEISALEGAEKTLKKHNPVIIMEVFKGEDGKKISMEAVNFLKRIGYKSYFLNNDGIPKEINEIDPSQFIKNENLVFKRK